MSNHSEKQDQIDIPVEDTISLKKPYVSPTFSHIESISALVAGMEGDGGDGGIFNGDTLS